MVQNITDSNMLTKIKCKASPLLTNKMTIKCKINKCKSKCRINN